MTSFDKDKPEQLTLTDWVARAVASSLYRRGAVETWERAFAAADSVALDIMDAIPVHQAEMAKHGWPK